MPLGDAETEMTEVDNNLSGQKINTAHSDTESEASSDHEQYHKSTWKLDVRLPPVDHIPRLAKDKSEALHEALTDKKDLKELLLPDPNKSCAENCAGGIGQYLSILTWVPRLLKDDEKWSKIQLDVIAGITVGVMAIPQSMSYADIAGLKYIYGMYSIFVCCAVYAFTGNSRQLGVGPVAMVSLIVEAGLAGIMTEDECPEYFEPGNIAGQNELCPDVYNSYVFTCSLLVGVINIVGGLLNMGFLVNFLAHPVISGFTSGAAIIIGFSQVKYIVGYDIEKSQYIYVTIAKLFEGIRDIKIIVFVFGCAWIAGLAFLGHATKNWPSWKFLRPFGPLLFCGAGIGICAGFPGLSEDYHVSVVGEIPEGFPPVSVKDWDFGKIPAVASVAISSSLIGYLESISIGKALANRHGYKIDAGGEMVALGVTNLVGSFLSCYPVTGSFSRSAVNDATGAQTQLAGLTTSGIMLLTLMVLTPLFRDLPKFALGAIVINSVKNLIAYDEAYRLWTVKRTDFFLWLTAFFGTLFLGIQLGIGIAVLLSLVFLIHESVTPQISILWRLPHTHVYANIKTTTHGSFVPGVLCLRVMGSVYFGNCTYLEDKIDQHLETYEKMNEKGVDKLKYVIISLSACTSLDSSAIHAIEEICADLRKKGLQVAFAQVGNRVWRTMETSGFVKHIGEKWFHETCHDAVQHCLSVDSSHITDEHHFNNFEKKDSVRQKRLDIGAFGVHMVV